MFMSSIICFGTHLADNFCNIKPLFVSPRVIRISYTWALAQIHTHTSSQSCFFFCYFVQSLRFVNALMSAPWSVLANGFLIVLLEAYGRLPKTFTTLTCFVEQKQWLHRLFMELCTRKYPHTKSFSVGKIMKIEEEEDDDEKQHRKEDKQTTDINTQNTMTQYIPACFSFFFLARRKCYHIISFEKPRCARKRTLENQEKRPNNIFDLIFIPL